MYFFQYTGCYTTQSSVQYTVYILVYMHTSTTLNYYTIFTDMTSYLVPVLRISIPRNYIISKYIHNEKN